MDVRISFLAQCLRSKKVPSRICLSKTGQFFACLSRKIFSLFPLLLLRILSIPTPVSIRLPSCWYFRENRTVKLDVEMACRKTARRVGGTKKRAQRATSNVFAMFDQDQIQEFKEAFTLIDHNRDGFIDSDDLRDMLASLGKEVSDAYLDDMLNDAPGPINFTMFLTLFGERLQGTDPEDVIGNAFLCFDDAQAGSLSVEYFREILTTLGDRFTQDEVDSLFKEAPISNGQFNYKEFTKILKHGRTED